MIVVIMIGIVMIFLMNNSSNSDFDHYFLNCYVLKILFYDSIFF